VDSKQLITYREGTADMTGVFDFNRTEITEGRVAALAAIKDRHKV